MLGRLSRAFALFMNWFDGICASVCGVWMMASAFFTLPLSWNDWMPASILDPLPIPDFMKQDLFWAGLALLLVNGVPNVIALVFRFRGKLAVSYRWGITAGILLIFWTMFELVFIPNGLSAFYLLLGVLQLVSSSHAAGNLNRRKDYCDK